MNKVILMGRLTRDPEVRYTSGENSTAVANYSLAVDRRFRRPGDNDATDFFRCVAFGRAAEFAQNYLQKGIKVVVTGRLQTGSYTNRDGQRVNTTEVIVEEQEFAESKSMNDSYRNSYQQGAGAADTGAPQPAAPPSLDGFMNIPDGIEEELPFT